MKSIFAALLALTLMSGVAQAQSVLIPAQVSEESTLLDTLNSLYAVQMTELTLLEAQQKYYEIMRASFQSSHALSVAFDSQAAQAGAKVGANGVQLVMDAYLARMWLRGATPSFIALKDIYYAARGQQAKLTTQSRTTLEALRNLGTKVTGGSKLKFTKNVVATAALGAFVYIQVENFWVINMSEAQYNAVIAQLDMKIANIAQAQAEIADTRGPAVSVR